MIIYLLLDVTIFVFSSVHGLIIRPTNESEIVEDAISSLATDFSQRYFSHVRCLVLITDTLLSKTFLQTFRLPNYIQVVHQSINQDCNNPHLQNILEFAYSQYCNGFIVQTKQPMCFLNTLQSVTQNSFFRLSPRLLFLPSLYNPIISSKLFSTKDLEFFPDVLIVDLNSNLSKENSTQFQMITTDWTTGSTILAECKLQQCLELNINLYPDKVQNLKSRYLRISAIHYPPYSILEPVLDGSDVRIAIEYGRIHNCSLKLIEPSDGKRWGVIYNNGTATGVFGLIKSNKADVGLGGLFANPEINGYVSLTTIYSQPGITLLVPRPKMISNWHLPFRPFNTFTWKTLFLMLVFLTITLYLSNKILYHLEVSRTNQNSGHRQERNHGLKTLTSTVMEILRILLSQSSSHISKFCTPVRQLLTSFQLMSVFVVAFYSSRISAILTVPRYHRPIETAADFAESGLHWGDTDEAWKLDLLSSSIPHQQKLVKHYQILTKDQLHARTLSGDFGFPLERLQSGYFPVFDYITEESAKHLMLMKEDLYYDLTTMALSKGSPLLGSFNKLIRRIFETGIHRYWEAEVSRKFLKSRIQKIIKSSSSQPTYNIPIVIEISHIQGPFILLCIGLSIAFIFFLAEILYNKYQYK